VVDVESMMPGLECLLGPQLQVSFSALTILSLVGKKSIWSIENTKHSLSKQVCGKTEGELTDPSPGSPVHDEVMVCTLHMTLVSAQI